MHLHMINRKIASSLIWNITDGVDEQVLKLIRQDCWETSYKKGWEPLCQSRPLLAKNQSSLCQSDVTGFRDKISPTVD